MNAQIYIMAWWQHCKHAQSYTVRLIHNHSDCTELQYCRFVISMCKRVIFDQTNLQYERLQEAEERSEIATMNSNYGKQILLYNFLPNARNKICLQSPSAKNDNLGLQRELCGSENISPL